MGAWRCDFEGMGLAVNVEERRFHVVVLVKFDAMPLESLLGNGFEAGLPQTYMSHTAAHTAIYAVRAKVSQVLPR